jgi:hypothetical protein
MHIDDLITDTIADLGDITAALVRVSEKLEAARVVLVGENAGNGQEQQPPIKASNGRLTEYGIGRLRELLDAGVPEATIARQMGISQPAVIHQRQRYRLEALSPSGDYPHQTEPIARGSQITVAERVAGLLTGCRGERLCDGDIPRRLSLPRPQQAQQAAAGLGASTAFRRAPGICSECGRAKVVTWSV